MGAAEIPGMRMIEYPNDGLASGAGDYKDFHSVEESVLSAWGFNLINATWYITPAIIPPSIGPDQ